MASVAVDTSAIAPPLPLPTRSDATAPAGLAGAFSDLLDAAAAPSTAPQSPGAPGARTDDGSSAAQASGSAAGASGANAAASSSPANSKALGGSKSTDEQNAHDGSADSASAAVNVTVVAGLALPPFAFAPLPGADQTPAASQDAPTASSDSAAPTSDDTSGTPADRKNAGASSDPSAAGLLPAVAGLVTVVAVAAPVSSASAQTAPVASVSPAATVPGGISTTPSTSAPATQSDEAKVAAPAAQQTDATGQRNQATSSAAFDLLTTLPSPASGPPATDGLQTATLPAAGNNAAPDQNPQSAPIVPPIVTSGAPSGTIKPAAAAALNPPAPLISVAAESQVPPETAANQSPPRDVGAVQIALPAQVAVRFAAPAHTADDATSDSGTDVLGGASVGATAMAGSSIPPGAALAPSFTGILSTMQAAPGAVAAPQHAAVATDAVPLAAVPIAIVIRAEAGERKFEIRLDPPDLGRIEVQLNVDSSGRATSHLVVDRADTLDLLRRDAPVLERALQSAGLTTDNSSLQFSLRDQSFAGRDQGTPAPLTPPTPATSGESDVAPLDAAVRRYGPAAGLGGGIDIRV